ncbi:tetratricopeptide repeat-containing sensor histidine kinase [Spirosoma foliorum]|uniref:histidine kinase n=1 Tax=Spirosoma foliorum TaxID=2710596 RepID=A0A7G5GZ84_9BACT|nr:histidine kinase dimerization/phosphoacceptor domain -containing protein [Spirosoma foliorum]QMW04176.1 tetratricopeptide repeat protein [Spirosoma foliorum]
MTASAQTQTGDSSRELLVRLQKSKPDTQRVHVLQDLATYYMFKPNAQAADMDSAMAVARQAERLSMKLHDPKGQAISYILYARVYNHDGKKEQAKALVRKAITIFSNAHYLDELGEAYFELGSYSPLIGAGLAERIKMAELALSTFQQSGNKLKQANCNKELGDLYQVEGNNSKALASLQQALTLYKAVGKGRLQGVYDLLGQVSGELGDYKEAIRYGLLAVQTAEQSGDSTMLLATIYNRLGITYQNLKELKLANQYFRKSIAIAEIYNDIGAICILATNISDTYVLLHQPAAALTFLRTIVKKYTLPDLASQIYITGQFINAYMPGKQYTLAQPYSDRLVRLSENRERIDNETQLYAYGMLIRFFIATQQYKQADKYLLIHRMLSEKMGSLRSLSINHLWTFKVDSAQANYSSAITHYQHYKALNDSLFTESKSKQIALLQTQFDTKKKDQDIQLKGQHIELLKKQSELQINDLNRTRILRNVTFIVIALLLIILALVYNRYRLKQRSNAILEAHQKEINDQNQSLQRLLTEKEWLLKEIHHRVKNNLQIVMSLLNTQSAYLTDEAAMLAIRDSQHRVQAISLIHQKLYQSENLSSIDMSTYIRELVEYLRDFFSTGQRIRFETHIEPVKLGVSYAVPIGLILNEAITNSIKYAFPGNKSGQIVISFQHTGGMNYLLTIADNGIGLPANMDSQQHDSLGLSLMRGLSDDIDGHFTIANDNGTLINISFVYEPTDQPESASISPNLPFETTAL